MRATFDLDLPLLRVDQAVRSGMLRVSGVDEALPLGCERPLWDNGRNIMAKLSEAWGAVVSSILMMLLGHTIFTLYAVMCH